MQVSICLGAILIPEYLDSILAILLPGAEQPEYIPEYILIPEYSQTNAPLVLSWGSALGSWRKTFPRNYRGILVCVADGSFPVNKSR